MCILLHTAAKMRIERERRTNLTQIAYIATETQFYDFSLKFLTFCIFFFMMTINRLRIILRI